MVFHNGSTYDYHFIIQELAEEFEGQFECLGENTQKFITFFVPIKKELDKAKPITYKIKFIDSFRFMSSSLSNLVDNLSVGLHCDKCTDCESCLDYMMFKDDQLIFRCFEGKKNIKKDFNKELIKRFASIYEFCNKDINKSISLLRKGVYPYEYMDSWERFDETSLSDAFYSSLNMEDITDIDHRHAKRVFKKFSNKNLLLKTLLFWDVSENFREKCIEIYKLDPAHFLSTPGLASQARLKKTEVKLELLIKNDMLLIIEKGIRGGICHAITQKSSFIKYFDANNFYGWAMSKK